MEVDLFTTELSAMAAAVLQQQPNRIDGSINDFVTAQRPRCLPITLSCLVWALVIMQPYSKPGSQNSKLWFSYSVKKVF
jgi:hypothetical protein